jgi:uncharacterized protein
LPSTKILPAALALGLLGGLEGGATEPSAPAACFEAWSPAAFSRARQEKRFVLLDLGAVWCHWCHVMEETTYRDPKVVALLESRFVAVRVDQDARPDLSNRYEDYGWPATIVFDADGLELVKFSGYIPAARMASLLQGIIDDPTPGPSARAAIDLPPGNPKGLSKDLRAQLEALLVSRFDSQQEGWGFAKKSLDWDAVEYSLLRGAAGDAAAGHRARATLRAERRLLDPVWGGVYQYSHGGDWDHPHFEKLMAYQAEILRTYAQACALGHHPEDLEAAREIHRYLKAFLGSPDGAFYVSQDADLVQGEHAGAYFALSDRERRAQGIPRVDTHTYARETAWAGTALVALHAASGEPEPLQEALGAAHFVLSERALAGGGFRHGARDEAGPYLGDTVAALRLFLALYPATGDRSWLTRAKEAAAFIDRTFRQDGLPGFVTAARVSRFEPARPQRDENIALARATNLLFHYTGDPAHRRLAERAMGFLAAAEVAARPEPAGVLLADLEMGTEPLHVAVIGPRDDARTKALLAEALALHPAYKRVELLDRREGPPPNADVEYPRLPFPAAFSCTAGRCSAPARTPEELRARVAKLTAQTPLHLMELGVDARR